jgi:hypothetical protein
MIVDGYIHTYMIASCFVFVFFFGFFVVMPSASMSTTREMFQKGEVSTGEEVAEMWFFGRTFRTGQADDEAARNGLQVYRE